MGLSTQIQSISVQQCVFLLLSAPVCTKQGNKSVQKSQKQAEFRPKGDKAVAGRIHSRRMVRWGRGVVLWTCTLLLVVTAADKHRPLRHMSFSDVTKAMLDDIPDIPNVRCYAFLCAFVFERSTPSGTVQRNVVLMS